MAHESPLFQSAMELVGHAIEHFNGGSELDRKLVILHLANAVELLLKDLVLDQGLSIYKNPKETISVHAAIQELSKQQLALAHLNKIELLIDERNALQHRYGSPNEMTAIFYMESTLEFFGAFLAEHYDLEIDEVLSQFTAKTEWAAFKMRRACDDKELENLKKLASVHPVGAFLSSTRYMEKILQEFVEPLFGDELRRRPPWNIFSHRILERYGVEFEDELARRLDDLRRLRNLVAHGRTEPNKDDVLQAISTIEELEGALAKIDAISIRAEVERKRDEREKTTSVDRPSDGGHTIDTKTSRNTEGPGRIG